MFLLILIVETVLPMIIAIVLSVLLFQLWIIFFCYRTKIHG